MPIIEVLLTHLAITIVKPIATSNTTHRVSYPPDKPLISVRILAFVAPIGTDENIPKAETKLTHNVKIIITTVKYMQILKKFDKSIQ
jgi:hypothetical protein